MNLLRGRSRGNVCLAMADIVGYCGASTASVLHWTDSLRYWISDSQISFKCLCVVWRDKVRGAV